MNQEWLAIVEIFLRGETARTRQRFFVTSGFAFFFEGKQFTSALSMNEEQKEHKQRLNVMDIAPM